MSTTRALARYSYPSAVYIDYDARIVDEEQGYALRSLAPE